MMTKIITKATTACLLCCNIVAALTACQDNAWDDHYGLADGTSPLNVMQVMEADANLSRFVAIVKEQHLDTLLSQDQTFTIWAPTNEALAAYATDGQDVDHLLKNHISRFVYTPSDLTDTTLVRIKMLNGKFQDYQRTTAGYAFASVPVGTGDQAATNGLVYSLDAVAPFYLNIFETICSSGNQTDSLARYLTAFDEYTFDRQNSTATGKNALGQLVYDSVFVYNNAWMRQFGDIYLEDSVYTVVMPTNTGWQAGTEAVSPYFRTFGLLEESTVSTISVPTRTYAIGDATADSLTRAHTQEAMASNLVFRGRVAVPDGSSSGLDSLVATSGNVVHHPSALFSGATEETVSNGTVWRTDQWNYQPEDCFLKTIVVEAEDTRGRTDAYANVFSRSASQTTYADSVSGQRFIEVNAATTNARTQPMVQFTIPNTLAAEYDVYVIFAPAEAYVAGTAADSTRVQFYLNYVHEDGRMHEDAVIAGGVTSGSTMTRMHVGRFKFPYANFSDSRFATATAQDDDCVRLRVQTSVPASETSKLTRTMRIDCIVFEPVLEMKNEE